MKAAVLGQFLDNITVYLHNPLIDIFINIKYFQRPLYLMSS